MSQDRGNKNATAVRGKSRSITASTESRSTSWKDFCGILKKDMLISDLDGRFGSPDRCLFWLADYCQMTDVKSIISPAASNPALMKSNFQKLSEAGRFVGSLLKRSPILLNAIIDYVETQQQNSDCDTVWGMITRKGSLVIVHPVLAIIFIDTMMSLADGDGTNDGLINRLDRVMCMHRESSLLELTPKTTIPAGSDRNKDGKIYQYTYGLTQVSDAYLKDVYYASTEFTSASNLPFGLSGLILQSFWEQYFSTSRDIHVRFEKQIAIGTLDIDSFKSVDLLAASRIGWYVTEPQFLMHVANGSYTSNKKTVESPFPTTTSPKMSTSIKTLWAKCDGRSDSSLRDFFLASNLTIQSDNIVADLNSLQRFTALTRSTIYQEPLFLNTIRSFLTFSSVFSGRVGRSEDRSVDIVSSILKEFSGRSTPVREFAFEVDHSDWKLPYTIDRTLIPADSAIVDIIPEPIGMTLAIDYGRVSE